MIVFVTIRHARSLRLNKAHTVNPGGHNVYDQGAVAVGLGWLGIIRLITGLNAGTHSVAAVLGGIFVIAVADAMSDALGIHLAEEADPNATTAQEN